MIKNVVEYLRESAVKYPNKVAIEDEIKQLTFQQLDVAAKSLATEIKRRIGKEIINRPIVVYMEKSADVVISFLAILYSGNFYCPIDVKMPEERRDKILDTLKPICIIARSAHMNFFEGEFIDFAKGLEIKPQECMCEEYKRVLDMDPIYTLFTSGSTGIPKGVTISHRGVIDYVEWLKEIFDFDENTVFGNQAPFYFDNSILDIYSTLKNGSTMIIIPEKIFMIANKLVEYINLHKINTLFWVPSALIGVADSGILSDIRLENISKVLFCGEVMPCKQLNIWMKNYPNVQFANLYGPTEITDVCTYYIVDREFADDESLPIGKACENTEILIIDDNNKECEPGKSGELCVRGCGVSLGYYSNWEKTEVAFVQNPLNNNYRDIIYKTGDMVYENDRGEIIYVGRKDFQIKYQGQRIELGEIESALGDMQGVQQGCAVYDEVEKKIVLFCVLSDKTINEKVIYGHLKGKLPRYMLPKSIQIIEEFPLNLNGKVDRLELKRGLNSEQ